MSTKGFQKKNRNMNKQLKKKKKSIKKKKDIKQPRKRYFTRHPKKYRENYFFHCEINDFIEIIQPYDIGYPSEICSFCNAIKWKEEIPTLCCEKGKIIIPCLPDPPKEILDLFYEDTHISTYSTNHIRAFNSALAMTSTQCNLAKFKNSGPPVFKICGVMHHYIGSLLPEPKKKANCSQIYLFDPQTQIDIRSNMNGLPGSLEVKKILSILQKSLIINNPLIHVYQNAMNICANNNIPNQKLVLLANIPQKEHKGKYNMPTEEEIAILIPENQEVENKRNIVLQKYSTHVTKINETHALYDPLQYVLIHIYGTEGFQLNLKRNNKMKLNNNNNNQLENSSKTFKRISIKEFYKFRLMIRTEETNALFFFGKLFQQYIVDQFAKMDENNLRWFRLNQSKIRSELYSGIVDAITNNDLQNTGKRTILPSSFQRGPRYFSKCYQNAMRIVQHFKKPDLFITFTCNPKWPEITQHLALNQSPVDRPVIVSRVFSIKLKELLNDLTKKNVFGKCIAYMYVVEFQKRTLPHAHILLILAKNSKLSTIDDYDNIVCAEIPNPQKHKLLFDLVTKFMVHERCDHNRKTKCKKTTRSECSKNFPKQFCKQTYQNENGFPFYRRRSPENKGETFVNKKEQIISNQWIVPYNPFLLQKYTSHINVEICSTVKAVKYLYKYVYKGPDKITANIENFNEISTYLDCRYIGGTEAAYRLLGLPMHQQKPSVLQLTLHLPNKNYILYPENISIEEAKELLLTKQKTTLTQWLANNKLNSLKKNKEGLDLTYINYCTKYSWRNKKWIKRKKRKGNLQLGRLITAHFTEGERYFLRLLLHYVQGATTFEDIRTFNNITYSTFREACEARNLLALDNEWDNCLREACLYRTNIKSLRVLFVAILVHNQPANPKKLWEKYKEELCSDILYNWKKKANHILRNNPPINKIYNEGLLLIAETLKKHGKQLTHFNLYQPTKDEGITFIDQSRQIMNEYNYNSEECKRESSKSFMMMNEEQKNAFICIKNACYPEYENIKQKKTKLFFLDAPGGTGKTFVANALLSFIRSKRDIAIATASSGIAAILLNGGSTIHSRFKVPIPILKTSSCNINGSHNNALATIIRKSKLIIFDETPMTHKFVFEAIDRTFRDIMKNDNPFGNKVILFSGDFRQILPITKKANRKTIINSCFNQSFLWKNIIILQLNINERIRRQNNINSNILEFENFLMQIGNGTYPVKIINGVENLINIPENNISVCKTFKQFIRDIFPEINIHYKDNNYFNKRAILTSLNKTVRDINLKILKTIPSKEYILYSIDKSKNEDESDIVQYSQEYLNSINSSNFPNHKLILKINTPIMLLRNINPEFGACNGTRLIIKKITKYLIEAIIITGPFVGKLYYIPRISLNTEEPIQFTRLQFPIKLAFAMTINKAQGQTLNTVGVYLPEPIFSHGQLYVAFSRVTSAKQLKIYVKQNSRQPIDKETNIITTQNIVWNEVFNY